MANVIALGCATVDFNIPMSDDALSSLRVEPRSATHVSREWIDSIRRQIEEARGTIGNPVSGGAVGNTIDVIGRSNLESAFIGMAGDDSFGRLLQSDFAESNVDFLLPLHPAIATGYNLCFYNKQGQSTIVYTLGANEALKPSILDENLIAHADLFIIDGYLLDVKPYGPATLGRAARIAADCGVAFVLTLAAEEIVRKHQAFFNEFAGHAHLLAGNLKQAAALVDLPASAPADEVILKLKTSLHADFLITLGADGVVASLRGETVTAPAAPVKVVDTTGAGDCLLGAFLAATRRGFSAKSSLDLASYVAGLCILSPGARLPQNESMRKLLRTDAWEPTFSTSSSSS